MTPIQPSYLRLREGELKRRALDALELLAECALCPRQCHAQRSDGALGICGTGRRAIVGSYFAHHGEEDCLRGRFGSGTIFFTGCSLRCIFCQNYDLSCERVGYAAGAEKLSNMMLHLQECGCHNINFVTPSHIVPQMLEALAIAVEQGLNLPLVYNTSAYELVPTLQLLAGIVDIYMPDFKYWSGSSAGHYAAAPDYPEVAKEAIIEMHHQVGPLIFDEHGLASRGLLLRHLVMPGLSADSRAVLSWIAENLGPQTYINLMSQYHPAGQVTSHSFSEINRLVFPHEFNSVVAYGRKLGLRLDPAQTGL